MKNLKPLNVKEALAGKPVMLRDGQKAYIRYHETGELPASNSERLFGYAESGLPMTWRENGFFHGFFLDGTRYRLDIVGMYPETRTINGFEVPATETEELGYGTRYHMPSPETKCFHTSTTWDGDDMDKFWLGRGLVFLNKEDAVANAKAMLGIDPYSETE